MVKNTTQIAKLHNRHGKLNELPKQLGMARIGLADDTNQVFIGNDENPDLQERYDSNIFPYGNVEILTEFSPLPTIIKYSPYLDGEQIFYLIDITGSRFTPSSETPLPAESKIMINGEEINFGDNPIVSIYQIMNVINNHKFNNYNVKAKNNSGKLELLTFADELILQDVNGTSVLAQLGFDDQTNTEATPLTKRSLQEVLDDNFCIKAFDVKGDGETDDSIQINKAFDVVYYFSNIAKIPCKKIYFPSSTYISNENSINVYSNTHIFGEGIDKTIIKSNGTNPLFKFFYEPGNKIKNVVFDSMTFDASESTMNKIIQLSPCEDITFKNCKFIAGNNSDFINNDQTIIFYTINNIVFDNCIFDGNINSVKLYLHGESNRFLITNCIFKNITTNPIDIKGNNLMTIQNGIIANNSFENCTGSCLIEVNEHVKYVSVVKSFVEERFLNDDNYEVFKQFNGSTLIDYHKLNYCDTPKITTDVNKFLRSNFYQDVYDYVQALYNKFGKEALSIISPENDVEIKNYFEIEQGTDNKSLSLRAISENDNVNIEVGENANLHIGGESQNDNTSIIFDRNIDVNDKVIKNGQGGNIIFNVNGLSDIQVNDENNIYGDKIAGNPNAIPNVDFVLKAVNNDNRIKLNYKSINEKIDDNSSEIELMKFNSEKYGNNVELRDISINIRQPFISISDQLNNPLNWDNQTTGYYKVDDIVSVSANYYKCLVDHFATSFNEELNLNYWEQISTLPENYGNVDEYSKYDSVNWYIGDVVTIENNFYVCLENHESDTKFTDIDTKFSSFMKDLNAGYWQKLLIDNNIEPDIKYISIISEDNSNNIRKWLFNIDEVNINARNVNGYNYPSWETGINYTKGTKVSYGSVNYECLVDYTSTSSSIDLHNSDIWKRLNESGYDYKIHFERDLWEIDGEGNLHKEDYVFTHNFSNCVLKLAMYDKNKDEILLLTKDYNNKISSKTWYPYTQYYAGDYVINNNINYIVKVDFVSDDEFNADNLEVINNKKWVSGINYFKGQIIYNGGNDYSIGDDVYQVLEDYTSNSINTDIENGKLKKLPKKYVQIGPSGEMIITINYIRGN